MSVCVCVSEYTLICVELKKGVQIRRECDCECCITESTSENRTTGSPWAGAALQIN